MTATQLAIIADDLTGALDAAAPFAVRGLSVVVATSPAHVAAALRIKPRIIAVSTNSRTLPRAESIAAVQSLAGDLAAVPEVFKKIDSRFKGHVLSEVTALAQLRGLASILVCPAIPEFGRVVRGGRVSGFGVGEPVRADLLLRDGALPVEIPDAATDAELDALAARPRGPLLVGARGFASALARHLTGKPFPDGAAPQLAHPLAIAIGTRDPITLEQLAVLRGARPEIPVLHAPNGRLSEAPPLAPLAILQAVPGLRLADPDVVQSAFAASFCPSFTEGRHTLVLSGGATAQAVLARLGISLLRITGECAPGIPISVPLDYPRPLAIVTKSGGFGTSRALLEMVGPRADPGFPLTGLGLARA